MKFASPSSTLRVRGKTDSGGEHCLSRNATDICGVRYVSCGREAHGWLLPAAPLTRTGCLGVLRLFKA
nr:MAG TPA: hypothetical protein [Caudoviricetes sp.]